MEHPLVSIVDDDASVREAAEGLLRSFGYTVMTFAAGEEFLASDALADTRCLVLDVQMPGLDGLDVQSCLNLMGRELPMVFITAYPDERVRARALDRGAISFLTKPFSPDDLISAVRRATGA